MIACLLHIARGRGHVSQRPRVQKRARFCNLAISALVAALGLCAAGPGHARDMTGKAGVGVLATSTGVQFLTLRYWRTRVATELMAGWYTADVDTLGAADLTRLRVAVGMGWRVADHPKASLTLGLRPWLQIEYQSVGDRTDTFLRYGAEAPLQGEMFLSDHFSVQGAVALSLGFGATAARNGDALTQETRDGSILVSLGGGYSGGLGVSYYF